MNVLIDAAERAAATGEVPVAAAVIDADGSFVVAENRMARCQRDKPCGIARAWAALASPAKAVFMGMIYG